ncbi:GPW/gp25 family protein [Wolbachia endosymbiont (group A) of Lasioglossum morio]|uniref:GPW/gp25 family protein n=1 Tax=Wolbachia endosymbiont (group A) of Lasioglossum morio TaxID=2954025 RepID=UPI0022263513|nr:GPW/gp25 family protein [Wolbachia endosymbiont (group A) of Lasioglossum morio]
MKGMSKETGKELEGIEHLKQSIIDILTTPIGSRVMRRDYGSRLLELVDKPINRDLTLEIYAAVAEALQKLEQRFKLYQFPLHGKQMDKDGRKAIMK